MARAGAVMLVATTLALPGCGKKSVVGAVTSATANTAGAAARTAGSAAVGAASTAGSAASSAASSAVSATASAAGGTSVVTPQIAVGTAIVGITAGADYDAKNRDPANMAEGVANCLAAGPDANAAGQLLAAAGWTPETAPASGVEGRSDYIKGNVRGSVLADGNCVFRSELITTLPVDSKVREAVARTFPKAKVKKPANMGDGPCDGFTLRQSRKNQAWIHYTDSTGDVCTRYGAGVVVQFL
ncbi:MAG: hypothetical protein ACWA5A_18585 [Marinibacterium sp.]